MPVKYWSAAGIMLSYWCNARCASCYLCCGPDHEEWVSLSNAVDWWDQLVSASPHGCRVHLTGGEPFGNWPLLIDIARSAQKEGISPLEKVETNAFWAVDDGICRDRMAALRDAGMWKISISADPYHQQFVPLEHCRRLAKVAEEVLGNERVQVRWSDWLADGCDTCDLEEADLVSLFREYSAAGRDRLNGRAATSLGEWHKQKKLAELADNNCRENLLRSKHVHIDPMGRLTPGTCAGIVLGDLRHETVREIWQGLHTYRFHKPLLSRLARFGPAGLLDDAKRRGFVPDEEYGRKCHLCWHLRQFADRNGCFSGELGPHWLYAEVLDS